MMARRAPRRRPGVAGATVARGAAGTVAGVVAPGLAARGAAAGVVVGLLAAGGLIASGALDGRATPVPTKPATEEFLAAYARSLETTYVVEARFTRRLDSGRTLQSAAFVAQRPPDRITREFGGINGIVNGHQIACSTDTAGQYHCGPAAAAQDYTAMSAQQVATMRSYFGAPPAYRVSKAGDHCFDLVQARPLPTPPYGSAARMCFDPVSGAMSYLREDLEGAVDTFEAVTIRTAVSAADFSLGRDHAFDPHTGGGPTSSTAPTSSTTAKSEGTSGASSSTTTTRPR
jgi:hypothetical protein